ncbi:MafI family immunity protein [Fusibacter ferrireducens]|uniref:MafI family immunity protein n=1 Tax=Fusibacter ferrireducens TaxID=2785058 RepID=A0ABR9ZXL2_9FIRM|nr:MafI family immunity protein [Fusibacter ferrireducens]MBF4695202.1 MafI family immunity protein [Fusibacter ferrireducens]
MDVNKKIVELLPKLKDFPEKDLKDIKGFLDHDEWGVAFEVICSVIDEDQLNIDDSIYSALDEIGRAMNMDDSLWSDLKERI